MTELREYNKTYIKGVLIKKDGQNLVFKTRNGTIKVLLHENIDVTLMEVGEVYKIEL